MYSARASIEAVPRDFTSLGEYSLLPVGGYLLWDEMWHVGRMGQTLCSIQFLYSLVDDLAAEAVLVGTGEVFIVLPQELFLDRSFGGAFIPSFFPSQVIPLINHIVDRTRVTPFNDHKRCFPRFPIIHLAFENTLYCCGSFPVNALTDATYYIKRVQVWELEDMIVFKYGFRVAAPVPSVLDQSHCPLLLSQYGAY